MTKDIFDQTVQILEKAQRISIVLGQQPTIDAVCAAAALSTIVRNKNKEVAIVSVVEQLPELPFLESQPAVVRGFTAEDTFVVKVSAEHATVGQLSYETDETGLSIFLKARTGAFEASDVTTGTKAATDALVLLGVQSFEQLGGLYQDNTQLFFDTPKINVDIHPANEYYGTVNIVEVTVSSLSEVIASIESHMPDAYAHDGVVTPLLAGVIAATRSFRDPRTTPDTLSVAARLVTLGARQTDIIQHLYKTKDFSVLKLWGRALARIATVPEQLLLYSTITQSDFEKTGEKPEAALEVLRDIIENVSGYSTIVLFVEVSTGIQVYAAGLPHANAGQLLTRLGATLTPAQPLIGAYEYVTFVFPEATVAELEQKLLQSVSGQTN